MRRAGLVAILTTVAMVLVALPALRVEWGGVDVSALSTSQRQRRRPGPAEEEQRQRGEQGEGEELGRAQVDVRLVAHLPPHHGPASEGHAGVAGEARVEPSDDAVLPGTRLQGGEERHAAAVPGDGGAPGDDRDPGIAAQRAGHAGGGSPARSGAGAAGGADERDDARLRLPPGGALDAPDRALARGPGHLERPRVREQSGHGAAEPGGDEEEDEGPDQDPPGMGDGVVGERAEHGHSVPLPSSAPWPGSSPSPPRSAPATSQPTRRTCPGRSRTSSVSATSLTAGSPPRPATCPSCSIARRRPWISRSPRCLSCAASTRPPRGATGWAPSRPAGSTCSRRVSCASGRPGGAGGSTSLEMLLHAPRALYARLAVAHVNPALPPPPTPRRLRAGLRWAWLLEGAAAWLGGQVEHTRPAIIRRLREGPAPAFPPARPDAALLGGTVFDLLAREAGVDAAFALAQRPPARDDARTVLEEAFAGRPLRHTEAAWRAHLVRR